MDQGEGRVIHGEVVITRGIEMHYLTPKGSHCCVYAVRILITVVLLSSTWISEQTLCLAVVDISRGAGSALVASLSVGALTQWVTWSSHDTAFIYVTAFLECEQKPFVGKPMRM